MRTDIRNTCLNCQDRKLKCHSTCERYLLAKEEHEKEKAFIESKRLFDLEFNVCKAVNVQATKKKYQIK